MANLLLLSLLLVGAAAAGDKDKDFKSLDLWSVRAHEQQVDIKLPDFESLELVKQHNASIADCIVKAGRNSLIDGSGGCVCARDHVLAAEGMCVHKTEINKKKKVGVFGGLFRKKGEHDDVPDMPECKGKEDCEAKLHEHHQSLAAKAQECGKHEAALASMVDGMATAFAADELLRDRKSNSTHEWIMLMRSQNKLMVGQLKRYAELDADNKRLSRDMDNVQKDKRGLDSSLRVLQKRKEELEAELEHLSKQGDDEWNSCQQTLRKLRNGLASRGIEVPKLE